MLLPGVEQMKAAVRCIELTRDVLLNISQGIYDTGMPTAGQQYQPFGGCNDQGHILRDTVFHEAAVRLQIGVLAVVFLLVLPWNGAGQIHARVYLGEAPANPELAAFRQVS